MRAVIILRSGQKIFVPVTQTTESFIKAIIEGVKPEIVNNYYQEAGLLVNFAEIVAICPEEWLPHSERGE